MTHLFNSPWESMNELGQEFGEQVEAAIGPIVDAFAARDASYRDMQAIAVSIIECLIAEKVLVRNTRWLRAEREATQRGRG